MEFRFFETMQLCEPQDLQTNLSEMEVHFNGSDDFHDSVYDSDMCCGGFEDFMAQIMEIVNLICLGQSLIQIMSVKF